MRGPADLVIMDWGIGGLSVYNEIRERLPHLAIVYYSDSGKTPYGKMSRKELKLRLRYLVSFFSTQGVRHFVIACNAASTVLPDLQGGFLKQGLFVTGVIERGIELICDSKLSKIAVIGGRRTILSRSYNRPFINLKNNSKKLIRGRIAQPLSALIEKGELKTPLMERTLQTILSPLKGYEALVLACTHYPAVSEQIQKILPHAKILDPAAATAHFVKKSWKWNQKLHGAGTVMFVTSGSTSQMKRAAHLAFQVKIPKIFSSVDLGID